jgi:hypothetical protein
VVKHNVKGQVVAMVQEELPLVEKRLAELKKEEKELLETRDYLKRVGAESGMTFGNPVAADG